MFNPNEEKACRRLIELALEEDLGAYVDLTSYAFFSAKKRGEAVFVARERGVVAGSPAVALVLSAVDRKLASEPLVEEGAGVEAGTKLIRVEGPMRSLLTAERTALNFLQHLSGSTFWTSSIPACQNSESMSVRRAVRSSVTGMALRISAAPVK